MLRILLSIGLLTLCNLAQAKNSLYQVDFIVFAHEQNTSSPPEAAALVSETRKGIPLKEQSSELSPYHLMPFSFSQLKQEYWALHRKPQYQILMHYTWLQPFDNQHAIVLPQMNRDGWQVGGSLRIRRSNYYLLDTDLTFTSPDQRTFALTQKQRLKGGQIYYLDHPQTGVLIKVHQLA